MKMVSWWGRVRRNGKANIRGRRELALGGWMEFWEISGDLGRPLQVLSLPPIPPNHNKAKSLIEINKLILLQFAYTRTHAQLKYEHEDTHAQTRGRPRTDSYKLAHT